MKVLFLLFFFVCSVIAKDPCYRFINGKLTGRWISLHKKYSISEWQRDVLIRNSGNPNWWDAKYIGNLIPISAINQSSKTAAEPERYFKGSELLLNYTEFEKLCETKNITMEDRCWLFAWEMWDLACSPMDDEKRRHIRYGHYLGWRESIKEAAGIAQASVQQSQPVSPKGPTNDKHFTNENRLY